MTDPQPQAELTSSVYDNRRAQMHPTLAPQEVERLRRFGSLRAYADGDMLVRTGESGHGLTLILAGEVDIIRPGQDGGPRQVIVAHGPGGFMGELAQLSGQPALVDGKARGDVEAVLIPPERLRALLVAEAEVGERIMRALI